MGFKSELIPESQQSLYGLNKKWVIDKDKNAFLFRSGSLGQNEAYIYDLNINSNIIKIYSRETSIPREREVNKPNIYDVTHGIYKIKAPKAFLINKDELKDIVVEALTAFGWNNNDEKTGSVNFKGIEEIDFEIVEDKIGKESR